MIYETPHEIAGASNKELSAYIFGAASSASSARAEREALLNTLPLTEELSKMMKIALSPTFEPLKRERGETDAVYLNRQLAYLTGRAVNEPLEKPNHIRLTSEDIRRDFYTFAWDPILTRDMSEEAVLEEAPEKEKLSKTIERMVRGWIEQLLTDKRRGTQIKPVVVPT